MDFRLENDEKSKRPLFYLAPMVRYSKLAFRQLVRLYNVDVCYTPMIYARNFLESEKCRNSELSTCEGDRPLIVQFATDDPFVLAEAAEMVYNCSTGVDLNCGCPKHDVRSKGFGSALLAKPDLLADMVRQTRARISDPDFSISLKIRVNQNIERTVDVCRKAESAGVTHLTVHGRTPSQRAEPIDIEAIRIVKDSVSVPIIANGGITSLEEAETLAAQTGVDGIMAANGLLENPALFAGFDYTPMDCVENFVRSRNAAATRAPTSQSFISQRRLSLEHGLDWLLYHQHLQYMLRPLLSANQRRIFNELNGRLAIDNFLTDICC